jgi:hypothetical protein
MGALPLVQKIIALITGASGENSKDPLLPEAYNLLGQIYWSQSLPNDAMASFKQSCSLGFKQACDHESLRMPGATQTPNSAPPRPAKK